MDIFTPEERRKTLKILSNLRRVSPSLFHTLFLSLSMLRRSRVAWSPLRAWRAGLCLSLTFEFLTDFVSPLFFPPKTFFGALPFFYRGRTSYHLTDPYANDYFGDASSDVLSIL